MLLHIDGSFPQVIEVAKLRSMNYSRKSQLTIVTIVREIIPKRAFEDWSKRFTEISLDDLEQITD